MVLESQKDFLRRLFLKKHALILNPTIWKVSVSILASYKILQNLTMEQ